MRKYYVLLVFVIGCITKDQKQNPIETFQGFLNWYETNYQTANEFELVNQDSGEYYAVNFEETEKYLVNLKTSGFVSNDYLNAFRKQFIEAQRVFENEPVNEGPPPNFDYDIILYTQEPEWVFENKKNLKVLSSDVQDEKAVFNVDVGMKFQVALSKANQKWMIDRISPID